MTAFDPASFDTALTALRRHASAGAYRQATEGIEALLATCPPDQIARRAQGLALLAHDYPRLGNLPASVRCATEAVGLAERLGDDAVLADALASQSFVFGQLQLGRDALDAGLRSLAAARRLGDPVREAWALNRTGVAYAGLENPAQACASTEQALEIARRAGAAEAHFSSLNNLAYFWLRRLEEATALDDRAAREQAMAQAHSTAMLAAELARRSGSAYQVTIAVSNLVDALLASGLADEALPLLNEFGHLAHEHGYQPLAVEADAQRAVYLRLTGEPAQAARMLNALLLANREPPPALRRMLLQALYEAEKANGAHANALAALEQLVRLERHRRRDTLALQTEVQMIREQVEQAQARADSAMADADRERARASHLEQAQLRLREHANALDRAAHEDVLTGLHNRRHAEFALPLLVEGARQGGAVISVAVLDVDHFKRINDSHGHAAGDRVLAQLAHLMRHRLRGADLLARMGGEEFLAVLVGSAPSQAAEICERLREAVQAHDWGAVVPGLTVTLSVGIAGGRAPEQAASLLAHADRLLYAAKRAGRNRVLIEEITG